MFAREKICPTPVRITPSITDTCNSSCAEIEADFSKIPVRREGEERIYGCL